MKRYFAGHITGVLALALGSPIAAQINTDGTVGQAANLSGPDYVIPNALGAQAGSNLCDADPNNNGFTNAQDYVLFRQLLGVPLGPSGLHP